VVTDGPPEAFATMVAKARSALELESMQSLMRMEEARERQLEGDGKTMIGKAKGHLRASFDADAGDAFRMLREKGNLTVL